MKRKESELLKDLIVDGPKRKAPKVNVTQDDSAPVAVEVLAQSIVVISNGIRKLTAGPLNEKALLLLIQHAAPNITDRRGGRNSTPPSQRDIKAVLDGIASLEATYLKRRPS